MPKPKAIGDRVRISDAQRLSWVERIAKECADGQIVHFRMEKKDQLPPLDTLEEYDSASILARRHAGQVEVVFMPRLNDQPTAFNMGASVSVTDGGYRFTSHSEVKRSVSGGEGRHLNFGIGKNAAQMFKQDRGHRISGEKFDSFLFLVMNPDDSRALPSVLNRR